jgi:DNA-binding LytR/AlgR family response regulator
MIKCLAIDDEPLGLDLLAAFCKKITNIDLVAKFTNVDKAKEYILNNEVDLLFLDIQMPDMNGIDFYKQFAKDKLVIFTTAFSEYAYEGFNVNAVDYLVKPFDFNRFLASCNKVIEAYSLKNKIHETFISIKSDSKIYNLKASEITLVESKDDYVKIHLVDGKHLLSKITTKGILEILPKEFIRVHRSFIINKNHVNNISTYSVMVNNIEVPIGKNYKLELQEFNH